MVLAETLGAVWKVVVVPWPWQPAQGHQPRRYGNGSSLTTPSSQVIVSTLRLGLCARSTGVGMAPG